jgi:hypothetical protein
MTFMAISLAGGDYVVKILFLPHPDFIYSHPPPFKVKGDFVPLKTPSKWGGA